MSTAEVIDRWLEAHRQELVELLARLIAAETPNPPGDEIRAARVMAEFFDAHKIPWEMHEAAPGRANILGRIGNGAPALLLPGHIDVVPAGEGWTSPPWQGVVRNGRMFGRGACDDKGPTAAIALAGACLKACVPLKGSVIVAGVADEERGSALGLEFLLREKKVTADFAIVPDIGGNMRTIDVAEKGLLFAEVTSHGRQAHGSQPELGVNAIWNLVHFLNRLHERGVPAARHALLGRPTLNLGMIHGGAAPNVVPGKAVATLDMRFLPGQDQEQFLAWLDSLLRETEREVPGARFDLRAVQHAPATEVPADSPLVRLIRESTREVCGFEPEIIGIGGATVAKQLIDHGVAAVGFSAGDDDQAHNADESIDLEELFRFSRIIARIAARLVGRE